MATERLYYSDAYLTTFSGTVRHVDGPRVRLDRTAFYPTSGGQQFDTGTLAGKKVCDVVDEGDEIVHILEPDATLATGEAVTGTIDWTRRFDHMQQHTGQHLLSALFEDLCGAATVSVHFGADGCTLDVDAGSIARSAVVRVEDRANAIIAENRPVTVGFEDAATAIGLRKASDRAGELRIVSIDGIDRSACGGTHVRATGEIGTVLIRRLEKYKNLTRIEFRCGTRAVHQARNDYDTLVTLAGTLTAGIVELPQLVASQAESLRTLESENKKLGESLAKFRAREAYDAATPDADGLRRVVVTGTADELRTIAHAVAALPRAVFIGACDAPPTIVFAAADDSGINAGAVLKPLLTTHGGRGGGNAKIAQGTVPGSDSIQAIIAALRG